MYTEKGALINVFFPLLYRYGDDSATYSGSGQSGDGVYGADSMYDMSVGSKGQGGGAGLYGGDSNYGQTTVNSA